MFSSLFVCLSATLRKNFRTDLREIFRESLQWANEQMIKILLAIRITVWKRIFFGFVTIGKYGKWYQPTALCNAAVLGMH